jgi:hypothetical protein
MTFVGIPGKRGRTLAGLVVGVRVDMQQPQRFPAAVHPESRTRHAHMLPRGSGDLVSISPSCTMAA